MKKNVLVVFGGVTCEHDISIITAVQTMHSLDEYLYNIIPVYINKSGVATTCKKYFDINAFGSEIKGHKVYFESGSGYIKYVVGIIARRIKIDCAVVCMHGKNGEDGMMSSVLKFAGIPYTCADLTSSAVGLDKMIFKDVIRSLELPYIPYVAFTKFQYACDKDYYIREVVDKLHFPVIVKPARLGSSIGIVVCKGKENLEICIQNALKYDEKIVIEEYLDKFKEVNIAVYRYGNMLKISRIERPIKSDDILSFDNKYIAGDKGMQGAIRTRIKLPKDVKQQIVNVTKKVYTHLGLQGVVRFDYMLADKVYLNEINTIPGSMANYLFDSSFTTQLNEQISQAILQSISESNLTNYFESSVLQGVDLSGVKK